MPNDIALSNAEIALAKFIHENIDLISKEVVDWSKIRAFCIQECVEHGYSVGKPNPIADACEANSVNRNYYIRSDVFNTAKIVKKYIVK